jgi:hypothetical protein
MELSAYPTPATDLAAPSQKPLTRLQPSLTVRGSTSRKKLPLIKSRDHREELIHWIWTSPEWWRHSCEWQEGIPTVEDNGSFWSEHSSPSETRGLTTKASLRRERRDRNATSIELLLVSSCWHRRRVRAVSEWG